MNRYLPALVTGFAAAVLSVVPIVKSFTCCLIIPFAAYLALVLDQRANRKYEHISPGHAVFIGIFTGLFAALFSTSLELIITAITKSNDLVEGFGSMQNMINSFPLDRQLKQQVIDLMAGIVNEIKTSGFSLLYTITLLFNNLIVNVIFGLAGALIGRQIINSRLNKSNTE